MADVEELRDNSATKKDDVAATLKSKRKDRKFHDSWAVILYAVMTAVFLVGSILLLRLEKPLGKNSISLVKFGKGTSLTKYYTKSTASLLMATIGYALASILFAIGCTYLFFYLMEKHFVTSLYVAVGTYAVVGLIGLITLPLGVSLSGIGVGLLIGLYIFFFVIMGSMDYLKMIIPAAAHILSHYVYTLVSLLFLGTILLSLTGIPAIIIMSALTDKRIGYGMGTLLAVLLSFHSYWTSSIFHYAYEYFVASLTVGHLAAENEEERKEVVSSSYYCTTMAMGTISFAAFLMGLLDTLQYYADRQVADAKNRSQGRAGSDALFALLNALCLAFLIAILRSLVDTMNFFTLVYSSLHGTGFVDSVKQSFEVVSKNPMNMLAANTAPKWIISLYIVPIAFIMALSCIWSIRVFLMPSPEITAQISYIATGIVKAAFCMVLTFLICLMMLWRILTSIYSAILAVAFAHICDKSLVESYNPAMSDALVKETENEVSEIKKKEAAASA